MRLLSLLFLPSFLPPKLPYFPTSTSLNGESYEQSTPVPNTPGRPPIDLSLYETDSETSMDTTSSNPNIDGSNLNQTSLSKLRTLSHQSTSSPYPSGDTVENDTPISTTPDEFTLNLPTSGGWTVPLYLNDFVVHVKYGIGRYTDVIVKEMKMGRLEKSQLAYLRQKSLERGESPPSVSSTLTERVIVVTYLDGTLHIPMKQLKRLSRYSSGKGAISPVLSKLKSKAWGTTSKKARDLTREVASGVVSLYAKRSLVKRSACKIQLESSVDTFVNSFKYPLTVDQIKSISDIKSDMTYSRSPMDRLICGDVGFGKTEVALSAIYRAVVNGRQCVLLSPTSVLASQHFKTCLGRFPETFRIEILKGLAGVKGKKVKEQLKAGEVDLVIGTHALLAKDVAFSNLGLVVIDEEQRFGVQQKERLKILSSGCDVLTLSATPIPRTLQMSLSGIRDTSVIMTPPKMRKPVETAVETFSPDIVESCIKRELGRGGQVFYVVPRISMIEDARMEISRVCPEARVIVAHGRMGSGKAEQAVAQFAEGEGDVLLATTVVENGIDIPSVNTIIVVNAQSFGMSTLYQLRGRVGRSNLQAYAVLLVSGENVTEKAYLRLKALRELKKLGGGFELASRDLEIRGAGSIFGVEQSGMAGKVGFDMYMKMLKKSINRIRGLALPTTARTKVFLNKGIGAIEGEGFDFDLPKDYVTGGIEEFDKAVSDARLASTSRELVTITEGWKKKYGPIPKEVRGPLKNLHLHSCTRNLGVDEVHRGEEGRVILRSPSLRPRHWKIMSAKGGFEGVEAVFPDFMLGEKKEGEDEGGEGGWQAERKKGEEGEEKEEEDDEDDDDTIYESLSALAEGNWKESPYFLVDTSDDLLDTEIVDEVLKKILPVVAFVNKRAEKDKKTAIDLEEKRKKKVEYEKQKKAEGTTRKGYYY
ncbi:hypothetical protein TrLO_g6298 [Triparma laevis f. longispina]|uniref:Uncharacterized protein n=1 Tax=Triparma laevis f. longispina TaxID=1714387 RepID=A0A9W7FR53_9STRA|nr:hypothetical protein TrLO_g6298 [Triparma laevis f. longispina]